MHGHWSDPFGQQEHAFLGSAFYVIQITWLTYCTSLPAFAGCSNGFNLQDAA